MKKALAVLVGLCTSGCAVDGWNQVQSKNITLYTNTDSQYKETLRQLENGYASLSASFFKGKEIGRVEVLFLDDTDFIGYFGNFRKGAALASVPGGGAIGKNGLLVLRPHSQSTNPSVGTDGVAASTFAAGTGATNNAAGTSAKEMLTHLFVQRSMPNVPLWFHEGFAAYVSSSEVRGGNGQSFGCFGFPVAGQVMMPVTSLWDATFVDYAKPDYRGWFQATSMTLIDFIMHADDNKHRGAMGQMVNDLAAGKPSADVVAAAFNGASVQDIDEKLQVHRQNVAQAVASAADVVEGGGNGASAEDAAGFNGARSEDNDEKLQVRRQNEAQAVGRTAPIRGQCPFGVVIPPGMEPDEAPPKISPQPKADMEALFAALESLPSKDEYPPYFPADIIAKVKVPAKK